MVETELWGLEEEFGLPSEEAGLVASSIAEATGLRGIGSVLRCVGGNASVAVLGRRVGTGPAGSVRVERRELGVAKKDVSTLSLDFLLCNFFAPNSSTPSVSPELAIACEEPPGDLTSLSLEELERRLCTEGSERREGRLLLEERDDLLISGMLGRQMWRRAVAVKSCSRAEPRTQGTQSRRAKAWSGSWAGTIEQEQEQAREHEHQDWHSQGKY